jgi:hypothetical protein
MDRAAVAAGKADAAHRRSSMADAVRLALHDEERRPSAARRKLARRVVQVKQTGRTTLHSGQATGQPLRARLAQVKFFEERRRGCIKHAQMLGYDRP